MATEMKVRPPVRTGLVLKLSKAFQSRMISGWQFSLVGKFNDEWVPQAKTTKEELTRAWQLSGKMDMILYPNNTFVFKLENASDFHHVLASGPYSVEDSLLMLQPLPRAVRLEQVRFNRVAIWVNLTGLPAELHDAEIAVSVGQYAGKVIDVAVVVGHGRCSARIKVEIEAEEPLLPGSYVDVGTGSSLWIGFKYEGLPRLCNNCMRIGHLDTECRKTAFHAKIELTKRVEAVAKKLNAPVVSAETTMDEDLLTISNSRSPPRKTLSCPTGTPTERAFKRSKTASQQVEDPQAMALTVETPVAVDGSAELFRSSQEIMMVGDFGPGSVGSNIELDPSGPVKDTSKGPKRKPKK